MSETPSTGTPQARVQAVRRANPQRRGWRFADAIRHWPWHRDADGQRIGWWREHFIIVAGAAMIVAAVALPAAANVIGNPHNVPLEVVPLPLPVAAQTTASSAPKAPAWQLVEVKSGQTLSQIFAEEGLGYADLHRVLDSLPAEDAQALARLYPHDEVAFLLGENGDLKALRFDRDDTHRVTVHVDGDKVTRSVQERSFSLRQHVAHVHIEHSLSAAAARADLSEAVMVKLTHIFRHKIDFRRDIRSGDSFTVIYNAVYRDGSYLHTGNVLAVEFNNRGHRYTAYRYELPNGHVGYYSQDGRPLSVSLLRTPVKYTRVSSSFGWRIDPVLHSRHLHAGVDLAAPKGTPIHAASRGVITTHRWVHGYGRYICIKLNSTYSTCYAHMSKYAKHLHDGSHVHQGEVIGYVGMTGYATGPHLHFEVRVHGKPVNPMTVTMPKPKPLSRTLLAGFRSATAPWLAHIQVVDDNLRLLAQADNPPQPVPHSP